MTAVEEPYQTRCAEIWGGVSVKEDDVATPGVRAAIHSSASGDTKGGDLYYFSVCAYDTLTRIAVADVRGHGEAVSHISEWLYESLAARMNDADGATVLADLNSRVRNRGFAITTLDRNRGRLSYVYAGHPPLFLGRQGRDWQPLEAPASQGPVNLPLGILTEAKFAQETVRIEPGDRLFLYSDGVAECPGPGDTFYGDERMLSTLESTRGEPVVSARERVRGDLSSYAGGALSHDDCTFMFVDVLKPPPIWRRRVFAGKSAGKSRAKQV